MSAASQTVNRREHYPRATTGAGQVHQHEPLVPAPYFRWKGPIEWCLATALLVPGLPVIALLVLLVRLTSPGPGIYKQARVGKNGRRFMMYKVRTMRQDAEAATGPVWTQASDPRVTPLGKVLRRLHLDELPQLFNVLRGEMSLVGPRPERPEFVCVLADAIPGYRNRLTVKPGVTGLAQINLPPDSDLASVQRKLTLDCEYIERGGWWLDFRLLLCTFLRIFRFPEAWLHVRLGLVRDVPIPSVGEIAAGNGQSAAEPAEATPAAILLQIGNPPNPGGPAAGNGKSNGDSDGHGSVSSNGHVHRHHQTKQTDSAKPR
jgi:lipopolysaccharide/colanic/teichoic acid biosynthesis glycosyltransferase